MKIEHIFNSSQPYAASVNWAKIASGNGLLPTQHQAITLINNVLLPIGPLEINFTEIWIKKQNFAFMSYGSSFINTLRKNDTGDIKSAKHGTMISQKASNDLPSFYFSDITSLSLCLKS